MLTQQPEALEILSQYGCGKGKDGATLQQLFWFVVYLLNASASVVEIGIAASCYDMISTGYREGGELAARRRCSIKPIALASDHRVGCGAPSPADGAAECGAVVVDAFLPADVYDLFVGEGRAVARASARARD